MTLIDRNSVVVGVKPVMSLEAFQAVLQAAGSPAAVESAGIYAAIVSESVEPSFGLACFAHESQYGKLGVCHDYSTKSIGNTRSSRIGVKTFVTVPVKGRYVKYSTWAAGAKDFAKRLVDPDFDYAHAGAITIGKIMPIFAPVGDGANDPDIYINKVVAQMNQWVGENSMTTLPNITWTPSPNFDPGPTKKDKVIIHDIEGSFDSGNGWIDSSKSGVSAQYIVSADGKRIDQSIKESDIAFHAGNYKYNQESIGVEHEGFQALSTGPYPDAMLRVSAALVAQICKRNGIVPSRKTIIGHSEVPPPNNHTDPGPKWPWGKYMGYVLSEYNGEGNQVPTVFNPNPNNFTVGQGVLDTATREKLEILTNEQYYKPADGQAPGLTQRSMTWVKSEAGLIYRIDAIQDQDIGNKPLPTWTTQIWLQTA